MAGDHLQDPGFHRDCALGNLQLPEIAVDLGWKRHSGSHRDPGTPAETDQRALAVAPRQHQIQQRHELHGATGSHRKDVEQTVIEARLGQHWEDTATAPGAADRQQAEIAGREALAVERDGCIESPRRLGRPLRRAA